ncbi:MAG: hypothetical protein H7Y86_18195 [Rhizobacter sp.]|nr:hypothetical protein [Ferruginibacter sp.]
MKNTLFSALAFAMLSLTFTSCEKDDDPPGNPATNNLHLDSSVALGRYIVDKKGRTLYFFANDANGQSNCTGGCFTNWKPLSVDSTSGLYDAGLTAADFTIVPGTRQLAYKGWPMYYYTPANVQEAIGQTSGEGIGGVWFVAKPDYTIMIANHQLTGANAVNYLGNYTPGDGRSIYFTDAKGITLYSISRDSALNNNFTLADFSNNAIWPVYEQPTIVVPSTLNKTLFVVMDVFGRKQLTFNGWPLYYFGADNMTPGSNKGITVPPSQPVGSIWRIVNTTLPAAPTP